MIYLLIGLAFFALFIGCMFIVAYGTKIGNENWNDEMEELLYKEGHIKNIVR